MACAGFILAGAEKKFRGAEKKSGGAESRPKGAKNFSAPPVFVSAPPAEFDSAPGAEQTRGGGRKPSYTKSINMNISHQFFDYTITFVN